MMYNSQENASDAIHTQDTDSEQDQMVLFFPRP